MGLGTRASVFRHSELLHGKEQLELEQNMYLVTIKARALVMMNTVRVKKKIGKAMNMDMCMSMYTSISRILSMTSGVSA